MPVAGLPFRSTYEPPLPNAKSDVTTPASRLLDIHYANLLLIERWNWDRYITLCQFLKLTPAELASLCLMPHAWLERFKEENRIPHTAGGARAVAFILTLIEAHAMKAISKDVIENPFPPSTP